MDKIVTIHNNDNDRIFFKLHDVMTSFQLWKDLAEKLNSFLQEQEDSCRSGLQRVLEQLQRWRREFERVVR